MQRVVRGATRNELDQVLAFISDRMGAAREYFDSRFQTCPRGAPEDSRIVLVGDRIASHARVYRRDLRLRGAVVPTGHLAEVLTDEEFRRQGHGRALLRDCVEHIGAQGWPISCVWSGVTQFYPAEHWVRFPLISTSLHLPFWRADLPPDVTVRRARRGTDDQAVAEIHEEYNRRRNLSAVRDSEYWRLHYSWTRGEQEDGFLVAERRGAAVGYCRSAQGTLIEYGVRDGQDEAGLALIDAAVRRARTYRMGELTLSLPADETVITRNPQLRYSLGVVETMLMRVVNLRAILDIALKTSRERLSEIGFTGARVIPIEVLGQKCAIKFEGGAATAETLPASAPATPLPQTEFFKLIFGATFEKDLSAFPREDRHLLTDLFPPDGPIFWRADAT